jgi:hypothetical protein
MQQQQRSNISLYHNHNRVRLKKSKIEQVSGGESQPPADFLGGTAPISLSLERGRERERERERESRGIDKGQRQWLHIVIHTTSVTTIPVIHTTSVTTIPVITQKRGLKLKSPKQVILMFLDRRGFVLDSDFFVMFRRVDVVS